MMIRGASTLSGLYTKPASESPGKDSSLSVPLALTQAGRLAVRRPGPGPGRRGRGLRLRVTGKAAVKPRSLHWQSQAPHCQWQRPGRGPLHRASDWQYWQPEWPSASLSGTGTASGRT
jgi:hypothetical protein